MNIRHARDRWSPAKLEQVTFGPGGPWLLYPPFEAVPGGSYTYIINPVRIYYEVISSNPEMPKVLMKDCNHYKVVHSDTRPPPGVHVTAQWNYSGTLSDYGVPYHSANRFDPRYGWLPGKCKFGEPSLPILGLRGWYDSSKEHDFVVPPSTLGNLNQAALAAMTPKIKSDLSLLNSVYELKDFRSLGRTLWNIENTLFTNAKKVIKMLNKIRRVGSDVYLQSEFNIRPLLSDIQSAMVGVKGLQHKLKAMMKLQARVITTHYSRAFSEDPESVDDYDTINLGSLNNLLQPTYGGSCYIRRLVRNDPVKFCATMQYTPYWSDLQRSYATILGLLDRYGLNVNPQIPWNAMKYTFLIDWVLGVSRWLRQFEGSWTEPLMIIHQYCWSIKRRRQIFCEIKHAHGLSSAYPRSHSQLPTITETAYRRSTHRLTASSLEASGLSSKEFSLGAALISSRFK